MAENRAANRADGRFGPEHIGIVRAVARWMLPAGRAYTDDEVELATGVLLPAITAGHARLRLRQPTAPTASATATAAPVLEVLEGTRVVASIPWDELKIDERPLRPPRELLRRFGG